MDSERSVTCNNLCACVPPCPTSPTSHIDSSFSLRDSLSIVVCMRVTLWIPYSMLSVNDYHWSKQPKTSAVECGSGVEYFR